MKFTRNLKLNMSGEDVLYIKKKLFDLGYFAKNIKKVSSKTFRKDTLNAVIFFQGRNKDKYNRDLVTDGIIGELTWEAIERIHAKMLEEDNKEMENPVANDILDIIDTYKHISADKRKAIKNELRTVSELRQKIVVEILNYAYDKDVPGNVRALYMIGGNLYNKDLTLNIPTEEKIKSQAKSRPDYYDGGRANWMIQQIRRDPDMPASDCSGMEVGYMRKHGLVSKSFDATANTLTTNSIYSTKIKKNELKPGDWVGKDGHIGTYVGGGYVVEFYGGAYGCQLTPLSPRKGWDFVSRILRTGGAWTRYRRPVKY